MIEGTTKDGNPRTLFRAIALNADQFKVVQDIIAHWAGETKLTSKQLIVAYNALKGRKYMPYFIGRNVACKVKNTPGIYNLSVLKLRKGSELKAVTTEAPVAPKPKHESKPKREAKAKKGSTKRAPKVDAADKALVDAVVDAGLAMIEAPAAE